MTTTSWRTDEAAVAKSEATPRPAWSSVVGQAAGMWLATRIAFALFTYVTVILNASGNQRIPPGFVAGRVSLSQLLLSWHRWDAGHFADIALRGYSHPYQAAFFPLYPMLVKALTLVIGTGQLVAADLIVSNLAALAAFCGVALLARRELGPGGDRMAVLLMAAYPLAFFTVAPYSDAFLLATAAFTLYFARQRRWPLAALSAFLAGLSRSSAIILFLPLLWEYGRDREWWALQGWDRARLIDVIAPRRLGELVMVAGAIPLSIGLFMLYLGRRFGDPLLAFRAHQLYWGREFEPFFITLRHAVAQLWRVPLGSYWSVLLALDLGLALLLIAVTILGARREPVSFTLYMAGLLVLALSAPILSLPNPLSSVGRELLVAVPAYLLLARWARRRPALALLLVVGGFLLQAALATYFLSGGWVE